MSWFSDIKNIAIDLLKAKTPIQGLVPLNETIEEKWSNRWTNTNVQNSTTDRAIESQAWPKSSTVDHSKLVAGKKFILESGSYNNK